MGGVCRNAGNFSALCSVSWWESPLANEAVITRDEMPDLKWH